MEPLTLSEVFFMSTDAVRVVRADHKWSPSHHTPGWEFFYLSGRHQKPINSRFTTHSRCAPGVVYAPFVSEDTVEWFILSGGATINGEHLDTGDFASIAAGSDCQVSSASGMEAIAVVRGRVLWAHVALDMLRDDALSAADADVLISQPWIEHLRRHLEPEYVSPLTARLRDSSPAEVKELCISAG